MQIGNVIIDNVLLPITIKHKKKSICLINSMGGVTSYLSDYEETILGINVKIFEYTQLSALKNFVTNISNYRKHTFQIIPERNLDLGNGFGIAVTVRYWSDEFTYTIDSSGNYELMLLFRKEA